MMHVRYVTGSVWADVDRYVAMGRSELLADARDVLGIA